MVQISAGTSENQVLTGTIPSFHASVSMQGSWLWNNLLRDIPALLVVLFPPPPFLLATVFLRGGKVSRLQGVPDSISLRKTSNTHHVTPEKLASKTLITCPWHFQSKVNETIIDPFLLPFKSIGLFPLFANGAEAGPM